MGAIELVDVSLLKRQGKYSKASVWSIGPSNLSVHFRERLLAISDYLTMIGPYIDRNHSFSTRIVFSESR